MAKKRKRKPLVLWVMACECLSGDHRLRHYSAAASARECVDACRGLCYCHGCGKPFVPRKFVEA